MRAQAGFTGTPTVNSYTWGTDSVSGAAGPFTSITFWNPTGTATVPAGHWSAALDSPTGVHDVPYITAGYLTTGPAGDSVGGRHDASRPALMHPPTTAHRKGDP
jgi:hypothetical protein